MNVMSVVKFKVQEGYEDAFIQALKSHDHSNKLWHRTVSLGNNEFLTINEYANSDNESSIDLITKDEEPGVKFLDSVEHMLEFFEEGRTQPSSGLVVFFHKSMNKI